MKVRFTLSIGFPTACRAEVVDIDDEAEDDEIEEVYNDWRNQFLDGGWRKL